MSRVKLKSNKGFTLVEIIAALAILGIIVAMFTGAFSNGFGTIIHGGQKTIAAEKVQGIIDRIYNSGSIDELDIAGIESGIDKKDTYTGLFDIYVPGDLSRYYATTVTMSGITLKKITVLVFYDNGKKYSLATSYIP